MTAIVEVIARQGKKAIIGLGKTGLSCARFLLSRGYAVVVLDSRDQPPGAEVLQQEYPDITVHTGPFDEELLKSADEMVVSPGVSLKEPAIQAAIAAEVPAVGDVDLFCREAKAPIVAITGSNAKSTVTDLVHNMFLAAGKHAKLGGNIGTPVLELLEEEEPDAYVLELSSFQLETTHELRAAVAALLNLSEDHMDRYDNLNEYRVAKHRIYRGCQHAVFNRDDMLTVPLLPSSVKQTNFGLGKPDLNHFGLIEENGESWLGKGLEPWLPINALNLKGMHNVVNALAALAIGDAMALPKTAMIDALKTYKGLPHRCEWVAEYQGVTWINDSKGTNVGATVAAINGLQNTIDGQIILLAGGVGKGADFSDLDEPVRQHVKQVILMGEDGDLIDRALHPSVLRQFAKNLQEAVQQAAALAEAGDLVLLSPACASFDMFSGYEERGDCFKQAVEQWIQQSGGGDA